MWTVARYKPLSISTLEGLSSVLSHSTYSALRISRRNHSTQLASIHQRACSKIWIKRQKRKMWWIRSIRSSKWNRYRLPRAYPGSVVKDKLGVWIKLPQITTSGQEQPNSKHPEASPVRPIAMLKLLLTPKTKLVVQTSRERQLCNLMRLLISLLRRRDNMKR